MLQTGFELLIDGGWEAVTVQQICKRAGVSMSTVYSRFANKEALLLAVHERAQQSILDDHRAIFDDPGWEGLDVRTTIRRLVTEIAWLYRRHERTFGVLFVRGFSDAEMLRRGYASAVVFGESFRRTLCPYRAEIDHPNPELAIATCGRLIGGQLTLRSVDAVLPGSEPEPDLSWSEAIDQLVLMASRYLLGKHA